MSTDDIDVLENNIVKLYGKKIFETLLIDRTTKKNIIWATNDYSNLGKSYEVNMPILSDLVTGNNTTVIQPRIAKAKEEQSKRTRRKAEVFTHSWICNKQNNLVDEQWFGRKNVFNEEFQCSWRVNNEKIEFQKKRTWKNYVDTKRMEMSCGEAPYLVSRYDTVTGEFIHIVSRIGLLDRKMRVVNENTDSEEEWFKWTVRAFQSVYGYEFQGDNLLLARENLLYTFIDNMKFKFNCEPSEIQLKEIANIISWNLWQMDGITCTLPLSDTGKIMLHAPLYNIDKVSKIKYCKIKDWRSKKTIKYVSLVKGG